MSEGETVEVHDPHYEPVIFLPEQIIPTMEEDEDVLFKMRAKLFRWAREADPPEWKERGTGDVKLLKHRINSKIRLLMRRDKTYKTCANHYLEQHMELVPNCGSDRAWVWTTFADFAEEEAREELLAIRFLNAENANKFKEKFCECQQMLKQLDQTKPSDEESSKGESDAAPEEKQSAAENPEKSEEQDLTKKLDDLSVSEKAESGSQPSTNPDKSNSEKTPNPVEDSPEK